VVQGGEKVFYIQSLQALSEEQMMVLVSIVLDEHGEGLMYQFDDVMLGLLEHTPGLETLSYKRSVRNLKIPRSEYRESN